VGTNPAQGIYRGKESCSARSVTLNSLNFNNCLTDCLFFIVSPLGETGHPRKNPCKNIPRTNEHLHIAALAYTRKRIQTLHGNEACQTSTHVAPFRCKCRQHLEILTTKPLSAFQTEYQTLIYLSI